MTEPMRVLIVEDNPDDAELMILQLTQAGFQPEWQRVETEADYLAALEAPPELILSDWSLPHFSGLRALQRLTQRGVDIPFIIVSGSIGEEAAIDALRSGADDYVLKDRPARLGESVRRALQDQHLRQERQQAEQALRASEERFRALIENATDLVIVLNPDGTGRYVSPSVERILGYPPEELVGTRIADFIHPDDLPAALQAIAYRAQTPGLADRSSEFRVRHKDGSVRTMEMIGNNLLDDPAVNGIVVNARDITERKRAEDALQKRELELRTLVANLPDVISRFDRQLRHAFVSDTVYDKTGLPPNEFLGKTNRELGMPENLVEYWEENLRQVFESGESRTIEFEYPSPDSARHFESSLVPEVGASGAIETVLVIGHDITDRKRAEDALRQSEEKYRGLVTEISDGIFVTDDRGVLTFANPALARTMGFEYPHQLMGRNFMEFVAPSMLNEIAGYFRQGIESGQSRGVTQAEIVRPDGTNAVVEVRAVIKMEGGKGTGTRGIVRDITERKRAEEALRESEEQFRSIFEQAAVGVAQVAPDGRWLRLNQRLCDIVGYTREELLTKSFQDITHPDDVETDVANLPRLLANEIQTYAREKRYIRKDGSNVWVNLTVSLVREPSGVPKYLVSVVQDITERKRAEEQVRQHSAALAHSNQLMVTLSRATANIGQILDPQEIMETVGTELRQLGLGCVIMLLESDRQALVVRYTSVTSRVLDTLEKLLKITPIGFRLPRERWLLPQVVDENKPISYPNWGAIVHSYLPNLPEAIIRQGLQLVGVSPEARFNAMPLVAGNTTLGELSVWGNNLQEDDLPAFSVFAGQVAAALENARLFEETSRRLKRVQSLHAIDMAISGSLDLQLTFDVFLEQVTARLSIHAADILRLNPHTNILEHAAARGFRTKALQQTRLRLGDGYAGQAALERRTIRIANLAEPGNKFGRSPLFAEEGFVAYSAAPLIAKGDVKGVLEIFHRAPLEPDREWLDFLETLAGQAAIAIDNAELFQNLQRSNADLGLAYDTTIEGWSRALDLRDKETEGHTQRVTETTMRLARAMGISDAELVHVRRGALLHDIGKMGVPDAILLKPGSLTDQEWEIMRQHPTFAQALLAPIAYLRPALDIPYCHHEKWDGSGYPRGLTGEQIPLAARLFAVVDVWDAITSDRPYRKAWTKEQAQQHIREQSGKHFDPRVVEAFLNIIAGST